MREERVEFFSDAERIVGLLRSPDKSRPPHRAVVQGPGWLGLKEARRNTPYHRALTAAGIAVLVIDYRGFGDSGGDPTDLLPERQVQDLLNATTYLTTRRDIDPTAIGAFGTGGMGGGNAVLLAARDPRITATVSQVPVADGGDWLRSMRTDEEWAAFQARLDFDRRQRVATGQSEMVEPRGDIALVSEQRRRAVEGSLGLDTRKVDLVSLRSADAILAYRPIDEAYRVSRLLLIAVEDDPVTPARHAEALFDAARTPKRLVMQTGVSHYEAYTVYESEVVSEIVAWLDRYLGAPEPINDESATSRTLRPD